MLIDVDVDMVVSTISDVVVVGSLLDGKTVVASSDEVESCDSVFAVCDEVPSDGVVVVSSGSDVSPVVVVGTTVSEVIVDGSIFEVDIEVSPSIVVVSSGRVVPFVVVV